MENLEEIKIEFKEFLKTIDSYATYNKIDEGMVEKWSLEDQVRLLNNQILPELNKIVADWQDKIEFIFISDFEYIKQLLKDIIQYLSLINLAIIEGIKDNFEKYFSLLEQSSEHLKNEYLLTNFKFSSDNIDQELEVVVDFIQSNFFKEDTTFMNLIIFLKSQNSVSLIHDITQYIIDFKNKQLNLSSSKKTELMEGLYAYFRNHLENEINEKKEEVERELNYERVKLEKAKNALIITAFGEKARTMDKAIFYFYCSIYAVFILIISCIFIKMNNSIENPFKDFHFLYFVSFIAFLSTFLTFLIKEKNNLSKQRDYFIRCQVELEALATYTAGFEKDQITNLKLELAPKYFTAGQNERTEDLTKDDLPVTNEQFKQILDFIKDLIKK
ncbi:hypothetical protein KTI95_04380 [Acinetobacter baumannii]|nr:hypothetical protein [Acinetobacter baumannii]